MHQFCNFHKIFKPHKLACFFLLYDSKVHFPRGESHFICHITFGYVTCWMTNNGSICSDNFESKETHYHVVKILRDLELSISIAREVS